MSQANSLERLMLDLINQERSARGIAALHLELRLNDSAEDHTEWMLAADTFSHTGINGSSAADRMKDAGFIFSGSWTWGENIATQSERGTPGPADDVADLHASLMSSAGHRANILNPSFKVIGIGIEMGDYKGWDMVMVTQNFARTGAPVQIDAGDGTPPGGLTLTGTDGKDILIGGTGDDTLFGKGAADRIFGKAGDDTLRGENGRDWLNGGAGADTLSGGGGLDRADYSDATAGLRAELDNRSVNTGEAQGDSYDSVEWLRGSKFADILGGTAGANRIWGANGNDILSGQGGNDTLYGGAGQDTLRGQGGDDDLFGKGGNDLFVFQPSGGADTVRDFQDNRDTLDFSAFSFASATQLFARASQSGADVVFDFEGSHDVTVKNVTLASLQDDVLI